MNEDFISKMNYSASVVEWDRRPIIAALFASVDFRVVGRTGKVLGSGTLHDLFHQCRLFGFFSRRQTSPLEVLLVQYLVKMTLRLLVKFVESLAVVHSFRVNLRVAHDHLLPDSLTCLFEVKDKEALLIYGPERVLRLDLFAQFAFEEGGFIGV